MATAEGLRYAIVGLPTPGSGLDDQDRHAIGGVVFPANSITPPTIGGDFGSKQRGAIGGVILPDNALDDQQDRYHIAGVIQPTLANVNISEQQRAFVAGVMGYGGGSGFTENDRAHIAGIYPYNEESFFSELFEVVYTLSATSTESLLPTSATGTIEFVLAGITGQLSGNTGRTRGRRRSRVRVVTETRPRKKKREPIYIEEEFRDEPPIRRHIPPDVRFVPHVPDVPGLPEVVRSRFVASQEEIPEIVRERARFVPRDEEVSEPPKRKRQTRFIPRPKRRATFSPKALNRFVPKKTKASKPKRKRPTKFIPTNKKEKPTERKIKARFVPLKEKNRDAVFASIEKRIAKKLRGK